MKTITKLISDPAWWFTVIAVSLLVNILASYLRNALDWESLKNFE